MKKWTKVEKRLWLFSVFAAALYVCGFDSQAMHIMEGYLPAGHCIAWGAVSIPFLAAGVISIRHTVQKQRKACRVRMKINIMGNTYCTGISPKNKEDLK